MIILCYGDSNTFGFNTWDCSRFDEETRWTKLLNKNLGDKYKVIEEGACNRTGFVDNDDGELYSAQKHFPKILNMYEQLDFIVLSIGTNDFQYKYNIEMETVETGLEKLISSAKQKTNNLIIIPPVILDTNILNGPFKIYFNESSIKKSKIAGDIYKKVSQKYACTIFDINDFTLPSSIDGLHYDEESHKIIANKLSDLILKIAKK